MENPPNPAKSEEKQSSNVEDEQKEEYIPSRREANRKLSKDVVDDFLAKVKALANSVVRATCELKNEAFEIEYLGKQKMPDGSTIPVKQKGLSDFALVVMDELRYPLHGWCMPLKEREAIKAARESGGKKALRYYAEPKA